MSAREQWYVQVLAVDELSEQERAAMQVQLESFQVRFGYDDGAQHPDEWNLIAVVVDAIDGTEAENRARAVVHEALPARTHLAEFGDIMPLRIHEELRGGNGSG
jgi:hypothetical protein